MMETERHWGTSWSYLALILGACSSGGEGAGDPGGSGGSGDSGTGGAQGAETGGESGVEPGTGGAPSSGGRTQAASGGEAGALTESGGSGGSGAGEGTGASATGGESPLDGTPTEEELAPLPEDRQEHAVVALQGEVFVIGGYMPNVTPSVIAYDPEKDSFRDVTDFPSPLNHPGAVVVDEKIYVAGFYAGTSLTGPASGQVFVYDPSTEEWTERTAQPAGTERAGGCVTALGSDIYVFGGGHHGDATAVSSVYNTESDSWRALPDLPESREHCSAFASGGKIYIAGGRTHTISEIRLTTLEFDPETELYTEKEPIPTARGGAAGAVLGGRLFLFGGEGNTEMDGIFANIEAYDPLTDSWEEYPPMLVPRHGYGAATINGRIYLAGGATRQGGAASSENSVFFFE